MGLNYGDLDNDGWLDFYLGTGNPDFDTLVPNRMFRNDGGRRFQDVTTAGGFGHLQKGHGVAFGDVDNDGDQDVFEEMGGAYQSDRAYSALYENPRATPAPCRQGRLGRAWSWKARPPIAPRSARGSRSALETPAGPRRIHRVVVERRQLRRLDAARVRRPRRRHARSPASTSPGRSAGAAGAGADVHRPRAGAALSPEAGRAGAGASCHGR